MAESSEPTNENGHPCNCECSGCIPRIPLNDVKRFVKECFSTLGLPDFISEILMEAIVQADYMGVSSEGVSRLEDYIQEIRDQTCDPEAEPTIETEFASVAVVDGKNGLGPVVGRFCMDIAIKKASAAGIGMVVAKGSNYFGMACLYTIQAIRKGYIGLSFSNSAPQMVPPGAQEAVLGTNPISVAAPGECDSLIMDITTTAVTLNKIEEYKEGKINLPKGFAVNENGEPEQDPARALTYKMLCPLGGDHKGYGLALLVDVLSGLLADSNYGPKIPKEKGTPPNLGHGFIAINPEKFVPDFNKRLSSLLNHLRKMEPVDADLPVLVPGDKERIHIKKVEQEGGIYYKRAQLEVLERISKKLNVPPIERAQQLVSKFEAEITEGEGSGETLDVMQPNQAIAEVTQSPAPAPTGQLVTTMEEARRFMVDCFKAMGIPDQHAETVAENLIEADYRGFYSHGMNRLDKYLKDIKDGICDPKATCTIEKETPSTAVVNGNNGLGAIIGKYCMDLAINKARDTGIALVVAHGSNHFGITQIYPLQAIKQGFLGLSFTNTSPYMVPTRAKVAALGTNPLALGAPALNGDNFLLDITTTAVALGKIEFSKRKGEPIPAGWALNDEGRIETNPEVAYKAGKLLPLGGDEATSGYKGYSLGILVDLLSGVLSGSKFGPFIRKWGAQSAVADLGQAFIAINPKCFAEGFENRLADLMTYLRNLKPVDPNRPILVHGDIERRNMEKVDKDGGLIYVQNQHDTNAKLAEELNVKPMESTMSSY